jgi:hypothetical protein
LAELLVIEFPSEAKAEDVREMLLAMQKEYLIELGDAGVAVKRRSRMDQGEPALPAGRARRRIRNVLGLAGLSPFYDAANQRSDRRCLPRVRTAAGRSRHQ